MQAITGFEMSRAGAAGVAARPARPRWLAVAAAVLLSAVAAALFGVNTYSSSTAEAVAAAQHSSARFEAVYFEAAQSQVDALKLGVDMVTANPAITGAFARGDRQALLAIAVPMAAEVLRPRFNITQFSFWTPPATLYLRADDPSEFGTDGRAARRSIVMAIERRTAVAGAETALGGWLTLRAIAPILDGTRLVGVTEFGCDLVEVLRRAQAATGVEFAAGLDRKRSDEVERAPNRAVDAVQGTDVFYEFSSPGTRQLVRTTPFNSRDMAGSLVQAGGRSVYVRPFAINNIWGVANLVVATVFDLTQAFGEAEWAAALRAGILFVALSVTAAVSLLQFQRIQRGFARVMFGERLKLNQTVQALEGARRALKDVDAVKQGFFTNVVAATCEPLSAVHGQLHAALAPIQAARDAAGPDAHAFDEPLARLAFSAAELDRLTRLLADYRKVELFRHDLVRDTHAQTSLSDVVAGVLEGELAHFRRLPQLSIRASVPASLPPVRASPEMLHYALAGLVSYAVENGGRGTIDLSGSLDEARWVRLSITGTAFAHAGTPTDLLLEDARQFIARLRGVLRPDDANGTMMALVLARTIVEDAGGRLDAAVPPEPATGFVVLLPSAS